MAKNQTTPLYQPRPTVGKSQLCTSNCSFGLRRGTFCIICQKEGGKVLLLGPRLTASLGAGRTVHGIIVGWIFSPSRGKFSCIYTMFTK